jgi:colanic acid biosynthesis glycosyl transferase WcaI
VRVLIISQYFWPEPFRINDLVLGLSERGHKVTVLTGIPNYPSGRFYAGYSLLAPRKEMFQGIPIYRLPIVPKGNGQACRMTLYYLSLALLGSLWSPFCFGKNIELILVFQPSPITVGVPALVIKRLSNAPILLWVQDLWPETLSATGMVKSKLILRCVEKLVRFVYAGCDRILVQSKAFYPSVRRMGVSEAKIFYFPNSAEELYKPVQLGPDAPERAQLPKGFRVVFAGNIGRGQDFATILSAAEMLKQHRDIHWVILGDGSMRSWVERNVKVLGLTETVHLLGKHPVRVMPRYFSLADALLVTLKSDPIFALTIPSKIQSYLACARPVVAALDGEGARIIAESGAGIPVPAGNAEALGKTILKLSKMPKSDRERMGQLGRKYFEKHFERSRLLDRLDRWMKEEVNTRGF